jgi:hypothetical protein
MRRHFLLLLILFSNLFCFAQRNEEVKKLVEEGILLHDKGDYEGAIKKYDEALAIDKYDLDANYEKSYTCVSAKKYDDCIEICKFMLANFPDNSLLKQVYEVYGNALDDSGNSTEALKIYNEGLKKFPDYYLLHFNKGLTNMRLKKYDDALVDFTAALNNKALHASSNYYTGVILQQENRIPSLLAYLTFIAIEPQTGRSKKAFDAINEIIYRNIKKEGGNTSISISMDMLNQVKDKKSENNFSSVEFLFSMMGSLDDTKGMDSIVKTAADKLDFKLQLLIGSLDDNKKNGRGFYWRHYAPFFIEMKEKNYTAVISNIVYLAYGEADSAKWISENDAKVKEFYAWFDKYKWD